MYCSNCVIETIEATKCHFKYNRDVQQHRHNRDEVLRNWRVDAIDFFLQKRVGAHVRHACIRAKACDLERGTVKELEVPFLTKSVAIPES